MLGEGGGRSLWREEWQDYTKALPLTLGCSFLSLEPEWGGKCGTQGLGEGVCFHVEPYREEGRGSWERCLQLSGPWGEKVVPEAAFWPQLCSVSVFSAFQSWNPREPWVNEQEADSVTRHIHRPDAGGRLAALWHKRIGRLTH